MEYSFQHYLLAKQSVDDRALNRHVYARFAGELPRDGLRVIEVGAGIGSMLIRLLRWDLFGRAEYVLVDELAENLAFAADWLPAQAEALGLKVDRPSPGSLRLWDHRRELQVELVCADVFDFIAQKPQPAGLLVAHAFLDLLPMPSALKSLLTLLEPGGFGWLTVNFDGVTTFEPQVDPGLDRLIEQLYHRSMDKRPTGGDSQSGRHLFGHLAAVGAGLLAAGASDWVVHPVGGKYPADEAYFLEFILHFFEESLAGQPGLSGGALTRWLAERRAQIRRGELVYIAHQMDFLVKLRSL